MAIKATRFEDLSKETNVAVSDPNTVVNNKPLNSPDTGSKGSAIDGVVQRDNALNPKSKAGNFNKDTGIDFKANGAKDQNKAILGDKAAKSLEDQSPEPNVEYSEDIPVYSYSDSGDTVSRAGVSGSGGGSYVGSSGSGSLSLIGNGGSSATGSGSLSLIGNGGSSATGSTGGGFSEEKIGKLASENIHKINKTTEGAYRSTDNTLDINMKKLKDADIDDMVNGIMSATGAKGAGKSKLKKMITLCKGGRGKFRRKKSVGTAVNCDLGKRYSSNPDCNPSDAADALHDLTQGAIDKIDALHDKLLALASMIAGGGASADLCNYINKVIGAFDITDDKDKTEVASNVMHGLKTTGNSRTMLEAASVANGPMLAAASPFAVKLLAGDPDATPPSKNCKKDTMSNFGVDIRKFGFLKDKKDQSMSNVDPDYDKNSKGEFSIAKLTSSDARGNVKTECKHKGILKATNKTNAPDTNNYNVIPSNSSSELAYSAY